jgi:two-component system, NarL family, sensor kinase
LYSSITTTHVTLPAIHVMKICIRLFFSVCIWLLCQTTNAQNEQLYLDSLFRIANRPTLDSNSVLALISVQRYYFERGKFDSTLRYGRRALPIARGIDNKKLLARSYYNLGMTHTNLVRYDSARYYLNEAEKFVPIIDDVALQVNCYNAQALLSSYQSDFSGATEYLMKAAELIDRSPSRKIKQLLPQVYGNIGHNLIAEKQIEKGIAYEKKALLQKDFPYEARFKTLIHLDVFDAYVRLNKVGEGKKHLDSAVSLNKTLNNVGVATLVQNNVGFYYQTINDWSSALKAYQHAYQLCDSSNNNYLKAEVGDNMANLYLKLNKHMEAERFARESVALAKNLKEYKVVASAYSTLKSTSSAKGNYKMALEYAELVRLYYDSATNEETQATTLSLESKYQNQKKENDIISLTAANAQKELEVIKRNRLLIGGGILGTAALLILGLFYKNSRQKQLLAEREKTLQDEQIKFLERQQQVVSLQSMINGQETERTRIAKDLHDGLGGLFSTVKMYFSTLQHDVRELRENDLFQKSYSLVDSASVEIRRIAHSMMPEVLMKLGLVNALKDFCDNITAGKLMKVSFEVHGMNTRFNANTEIMLYRIIQELLNNIMKHANATAVIIQFVREENRLSVVVEDNGQGFNTQQADEKKNAGLETVKSRVNYLNGHLNIDSEKGVGTTIMIDLLINE